MFVVFYMQTGNSSKMLSARFFCSKIDALTILHRVNTFTILHGNNTFGVILVDTNDLLLFFSYYTLDCVFEKESMLYFFFFYFCYLALY